MSSSRFDIQEHVIPCQHLREYPRGTSNRQEDSLQLAIKQYTPLNNVKPQSGDVTIIGAHANGFPKELYEPLWDDLLHQSNQKGFKIRAIWMADVAHQGDSGVLNEHLIGNDPSWFDHSRDLLHMINHFRDQMPRPIVGIGHSMGGTQLVHLSLIHPRLLTSLILLDPIIDFQLSTQKNMVMIRSSALRRDVWPSRREAELSFRDHPFYRTWDDRVLNLWLRHGLRALPTLVHPSTDIPQAVTLKTTKHQEVFTFLRPLSPADIHPDGYQPYRPEPSTTLHNLPLLRPGTLYVFGARSTANPPEAREVLLERTGTKRERRVRAVVLDRAGHLVPMEAVRECAQAAAGWLADEMERWKRDEADFERWREKSPRDKSMIGEEMIRMIDTASGGIEGRVKGRL